MYVVADCDVVIADADDFGLFDSLEEAKAAILYHVNRVDCPEKHFNGRRFEIYHVSDEPIIQTVKFKPVTKYEITLE